uniref:Shisa like 2A n=1 Tax=Salmo trutta TaxID=8032 RepID=A0A673XPH7_SALTR
MSAECTSYYSADNVFVNGSSCPKAGGDARAAFCCGFNDIKYCCDDPNSFFPYEYGYMWWLSVGALIGLSIAAVVLLAFLITVFVLCYLFIATKHSRLDNSLPLRAPEDKFLSHYEQVKLLLRVCVCVSLFQGWTPVRAPVTPAQPIPPAPRASGCTSSAGSCTVTTSRPTPRDCSRGAS